MFQLVTAGSAAGCMADPAGRSRASVVHAESHAGDQPVLRGSEAGDGGHLPQAPQGQASVLARQYRSTCVLVGPAAEAFGVCYL